MKVEDNSHRVAQRPTLKFSKLTCALRLNQSHPVKRLYKLKKLMWNWQKLSWLSYSPTGYRKNTLTTA